MVRGDEIHGASSPLIKPFERGPAELRCSNLSSRSAASGMKSATASWLRALKPLQDWLTVHQASVGEIFLLMEHLTWAH